MHHMSIMNTQRNITYVLHLFVTPLFFLSFPFFVERLIREGRRGGVLTPSSESSDSEGNMVKFEKKTIYVLRQALWSSI